MRMIDGQLAFPDEEPPLDWQELRIAIAGDMVTIRRDSGTVSIVTWGNATGEIRRAWNAVALAFAELSGGMVQNEDGTWTATEFGLRTGMTT
jgi:hypothetical protein